MKTIRNILLLTVVALSTACSDNFLHREPAGSTMLHNQYVQLSDKLEGSMRGVYSMLYKNSSTDHDAFGQRAIDMYGDLLCGDMALTSEKYGWFVVDERMQTRSYRTSFIWGYYYDIIRNTNLVLALVKEQSDLLEKVAEYGFPTDLETDEVFTETDLETAVYYAEALTMRGYAYANLVRFFTVPVSEMTEQGLTIDTYPVLPLYTEDNMSAPHGLSNMGEVYARIENDLTTAIDYFNAFADGYVKSSKLEVDKYVAGGLLAYAYLNKAEYCTTQEDGKTAYTNALNRAKEVIETSSYEIIPNDDLLETGFNNLESNSWMWGQNVTTETATGLASFWGHVDIHTYSYAWSGDTKVIDENLKDTIPSWDGRAKWFNDGKEKGQYKDCPDGKFFSEANRYSTKDEDIDREWLSDNVFMRIELMHLIAAEASYYLLDYPTAVDYLTNITDERLDKSSLTAADEYATYKSSLSNSNLLLDAIKYNWRIELWGEGYGLQTLKRLTKSMKRGGNHLDSAGKEFGASDPAFLFDIPNSEFTYNPNL